jgi:fumarate hydratase, class II
MPHRIEKDSLGEVRVPADALYGAQTQRAVENFPISGQRFPRRFLRSLGIVKRAAADTNAELGRLDPAMHQAIAAACDEVIDGRWDAEFPIDIYQTGSGTSTNMNANEVIAHRAAQILGSKVHPNDHVNASQSSNDVIPTVLHVAGATAIEDDLVPALRALAAALEQKSKDFADIVKSGRTHLMDATRSPSDRNSRGTPPRLPTPSVGPRPPATRSSRWPSAAPPSARASTVRRRSRRPRS